MIAKTRDAGLAVNLRIEGKRRHLPAALELSAFAGSATFHKTHGHWHYDDIFTAQLYRVENGDLQATSTELEKRGACASDWVLVDFERFYQARKGAHHRGHRCDSFFPHENVGPQPVIALSHGWGDIYGIDSPDNYVDFSSLGNGEYVMRIWIDQWEKIKEIKEDDNVGYALFTVSGCPLDCSADLVERGRGTDPWDPQEVVLGNFQLGE